MENSHRTHLFAVDQVSIQEMSVNFVKDPTAQDYTQWSVQFNPMHHDAMATETPAQTPKTG